MTFIFILLFFAVIIVIGVAIDNFKNRAIQHVLKNTGASQADVDSGISGEFEKIHMSKFLAEHTNYTEESIKQILTNFAYSLINKNSLSEFSEKVNDKMINDTKLEKLREMTYKRTTINMYLRNRISAIVVFATERDEYNIGLECNVSNGNVILERYNISKGNPLGF